MRTPKTNLRPYTDRRSIRKFLIPILALAILSSCSAGKSGSGVSLEESGQNASVTETNLKPTSSPGTLTPTPADPTLLPPYSIWLTSAAPQALRKELENTNLLTFTTNKEAADLIVSFEAGDQSGEWLYAAAAPFYALKSDVNLRDLQNCWTTGNSGASDFSQIIVTPNTSNVFSTMWGSANLGCITVASDESLSDTLWRDPDALALIPFENLDPSFRILAVNDQDPLAADFDPSLYPLAVPVFTQGLAIIQEGRDEIRATLKNFSANKLSTIVLTGVTALVRDTAVIMETEGITYPAEDIKELLVSADITHINNEVPFAEDCPPPTSSQNSLRFCSSDKYLELLIEVGTDVVELSGDHFGDWGPEAMLHTLDLYDQAGIPTYGGGKNLAAGLAPLIIEHNGNQFAFIGCNAKSYERYATASSTNPGAAGCDFDWMTAEITDLTERGYLVIATMQHEEVDSFSPIAWQQYDFRNLAQAGAKIVSGSQAHHPQALEYTGSSFIHYGLGNLFFDQYYLAQYYPEAHINKDKAFIDLHYFFNGRHISTRLVPIQFIDNARPRLMTPEEQGEFFEQVFKASRWKNNWIYLYETSYFSAGN